MGYRHIRGLFHYHAAHTEEISRHDYYNVYLKTIKDLRKTGFNRFDSMQILDLGCGQRYPLSLLFSSMGAHVTALDVNYVKRDNLPVYFYQVLKHNGIERALNSVVRRVLFDKRYYEMLEKSSTKRLRKENGRIRFVVAAPAEPNYPLESESFNLIVSNAVIEHVQDLQKYVAEIDRLLVKNGYFYGVIHNFYSLSGGHHLDWAFPDAFPSEKVPPWDHLRKNTSQTHVYLNRLKPKEYQACFSRRLHVELFEGRDINHDPGGTEGEHFLTEKVRKELSAYPRDLLLTRSWCIICQKYS